MGSSRAVSDTFAPGAASPEAGERDADWAIVERVKAGQVGAYDRLVRAYRERIFAVIYNMTGNREDAADLTQETFIKAFQAIGRFRGKAAFATWIYRIAVNTTLTFLKKNRRRRYFSFESLADEATADEAFEALVSKTGADAPLLARELQEKLNEALQKLSPKHRAVVVLHEIEGLEHGEIARITRVSVGTVRSRLHYAKQRLQADLNPYIA